jgi:hypothetical protein
MAKPPCRRPTTHKPEYILHSHSHSTRTAMPCLSTQSYRPRRRARNRRQKTSSACSRSTHADSTISRANRAFGLSCKISACEPRVPSASSLTYSTSALAAARTGWWRELVPRGAKAHALPIPSLNLLRFTRPRSFPVSLKAHRSASVLRNRALKSLFVRMAPSCPTSPNTMQMTKSGPRTQL